MTVSCPLTQSSEVILLEKIPVKFLIERYEKLLKKDISGEFMEVQEIHLYYAKNSDIKFFHPLISGLESFYKKLQRFDWYYLDDKNEYDYASHYIRDTDKVLEVGCGKGAFSRKIKSPYYTGLEFSKDAISIASKDNIKIFNKTVENHCKNHQEHYDVVCSFQVLEHVTKPDLFIQSCIDSCIDCIKPNGLLIISFPNDNSFIGSLRNNILNMPPHHVTHWSDKALRKVANYFELKLVDIHQEKMADIHRKLYSRQLIVDSVKKLLGIEDKNWLLDHSLSYRLLSKLAYSIRQYSRWRIRG